MKINILNSHNNLTSPERPRGSPSRTLRASSLRRGVILIVVLALLALFAAVALAFVLYANGQAAAARVAREAEVPSRAGLDPDHLASYFLGQFLYDAEDDERGVFSALRGHSLARSLYGYDDDGHNDTPYNGTGRLRRPGQNDYDLINYTYFSGDKFLRDPERFGTRPDLRAPKGPFAGGFNAPYTYPDLNNCYLAAVKADGTVLLPSFHRPWLFGGNDRNNPNWDNVTGKYLLLRPRPKEMGPGFPYPEDDGGDVKNLTGAPGGNDSYWIDLDFPVLTAPDGKKYKPLFAPLVVDLDNRVNLNVHGNVRGGGRHVSHQGWGPWEVNLGRVLSQAAPGGAPEWPNLFLGRGAARHRGRYGADLAPGAERDQAALSSLAGPFYSRVDIDASVVAPPAGPRPFSAFPAYAPGHDNASPAECLEHPSLSHPGRHDDRGFAAAAMEHLLAGGLEVPSLEEFEPARLCPINFTTARARGLVTTVSADLDRPGVMPWGGGPYVLQGKSYPTGGDAPLPKKADEIAAARALAARLSRVALDRPLPPYPRPDATGRITDLDGFRHAESARTELARALYLRLRVATGAAEPNAVAVGSAEYDALRWLAQLAANIVDFIDPDDTMTPFEWFAAPGLPRQVVVGTELPRVVLNEVYAEATNDKVNVWVELHNPFFTDAALSDGGAARLQVGGQAAYRLLVTRSPCPALTLPENSYGEPHAADVRVIQARWSPDLLLPANGAAQGPPGGNVGFYVVGPGDDLPGKGSPQPTLRADMTYPLPPLASLHEHVVLLQRLACPALPPGPNNPYVTVDSVERVPTNDARTVGTDGKQPHTPTPVTSRFAVGRTQPYAAGSTRPQPPAPASASEQPCHTFFRHNFPGTPFDWLAHLDRPPVSPAELLSVSGFKPHQLTQRFVALDGTPHAHRAPWLDQTSRLFRFLEFVRCRPTSREAPGGRLTGLVNVNTLWDPDVFFALCDPQPANNFKDADLRGVWNRLLESRTPGLLTPGGGPGANDRPFLGFAAPVTPAGDDQFPGAGLDNTLLAKFDLNGARRLLQPETPPGTHPHVENQLFTKVFNHLTTRSNVFAVWVTVGLFEVTDASARPVKLGAELGRAEGRNTRYRLFAVVDRSRMTLFSTTSGDADIEEPGRAEVTPRAMAGRTPSGRPWSIQAEMLLTVGDGDDEETVAVESVTPKSFTATFARPHAAGRPVLCRGNPGPWPRFSHHGHWPVVLAVRTWTE